MLSADMPLIPIVDSLAVRLLPKLGNEDEESYQHYSFFISSCCWEVKQSPHTGRGSNPFILGNDHAIPSCWEMMKSPHIEMRCNPSYW